MKEFRWCCRNDLSETKFINKLSSDRDHTDQDHTHLYRVIERHRPHSSDICIDHREHRSDHHAPDNRDSCKNIKHKTDSDELGRRPTKVRQNDRKRQHHRNRLVISFRKIVSNSEMIERIEFGDKEHTYKNEAECCTERIGHHTHKSPLCHRRSCAH